MAAKMPMTARKNIRDSEPDRDKAMADINKACGRDMTFVPDFEANFPVFLASRQENIGPIYHKTFLPAIAEMLRKNFEDKMIKEAFDKTVTKNEIRFKVGTVKREDTKGQSSYNDVFFQDGCLMLVHTAEPCNIGDINNFNLAVVRGLHQSSSFPLNVRQNMVANESKRDEALAKISKATGEKWTFDEKCLETMWTEGYEKNPDWERYKTQVGGFWYKEALTNLANNIETICKDDMVKEGFNETFTGHVISFKYVGKSCPTYWVPKNEGGNLVIDFKDLTNFGNLGEVKTVDLVKLL